MKLITCFTIVVALGLTTATTAGIPQMINYQGYLTNPSGNPVGNGDYQIIFSIYDVLVGGTPIWASGSQTVSVNKGMFLYPLGSAAPLPDDLFEADTLRWLGIKVGSDDELSPRTQLVSVPYAYHALRADTAAIALATIGSSSNWTVIDSVLYTNSYWGLSRGAVGNVLHGDSSHTMVNLGVACTTGVISQDKSYSTISGGLRNRSEGDYSTIGGGQYNLASSGGTVGGGLNNSASGDSSTIGGGAGNYALGRKATIGGGISNTALGHVSTVVGGESNYSDSHYGFIGGGQDNYMKLSHNVISGGRDNYIFGSYCVIGGGWDNLIPFTGSAAYNTISGGGFNHCEGHNGTIGGGVSNINMANNTVIGGGSSNETHGDFAVISGGAVNKVIGTRSTVSGGQLNVVESNYSSISGGYADTIFTGADYSYLFGINSNLTEDSTFMVDMPHIRFGDETTGYEFPTEDGTSGQVISTDGNGQLSWTDPASAALAAIKELQQKTKEIDQLKADIDKLSDLVETLIAQKQD